MRRLKEKDVYEYLSVCKNYYALDNNWVPVFEGGSEKIPPDIFNEALVAAAACYGRVPHDSNGMLLLGDTKIRRDAEYILNFGVTDETAEKVDKDTVQLIMRALGQKVIPETVTHKDVEKLRNQIIEGQPPHKRGQHPLVNVKFFGPGSVLATTKWTPALNDCFILAGIHTNMMFVLALNTDEQGEFAKLKSGVVNDLTKKFGGLSELKKDKLARDAWLEFLSKNERILWDTSGKNDIPRVFTRELLGLLKFGYSPVFSEYQLSFECASEAKADNAGFLAYCEWLNSLQFQAAKESKDKIIGEISAWLFGDRDALKYPAKAA